MASYRGTPLFLALLLALIAPPASASVPDFTCVQVNERVAIDAPAGRDRTITPVDFGAYPDPAFLLITVSNRGNHRAGLLTVPDADVHSEVIARAHHSASGRLLVSHTGVVEWLIGPGEGRLRFDVTIDTICMYP